MPQFNVPSTWIRVELTPFTSGATRVCYVIPDDDYIVPVMVQLFIGKLHRKANVINHPVLGQFRIGSKWTLEKTVQEFDKIECAWRKQNKLDCLHTSIVTLN